MLLFYIHGFQWTDITANFDLSILRLRVMAGLPGKEQRIASLQIPLHLIEVFIHIYLFIRILFDLMTPPSYLSICCRFLIF